MRTFELINQQRRTRFPCTLPAHKRVLQGCSQCGNIRVTAGATANFNRYHVSSANRFRNGPDNQQATAPRRGRSQPQPASRPAPTRAAPNRPVPAPRQGTLPQLNRIESNMFASKLEVQSELRGLRKKLELMHIEQRAMANQERKMHNMIMRHFGWLQHGQSK